MPPWPTLILAVLAETIGTTALEASRQFTRLGPSLVVVVAYALSFWLLSLTLRTIPVGIVYGLWSGLGIVLIAIIGWLVFGQRLDGPAILGLTLILTGVLVIHVFSGTATKG